MDEARCPFCGCELSLAPDGWDAIAIPRIGRSAMIAFREIGLAGAIALTTAQCGGAATATRPEPAIVLYGGPSQQREEWLAVGRLSFAPGSDVLDDAARGELRALVARLRERNDIQRFRLSGHVDPAMPEPGDLAQRRAISVGNELVELEVPRELIDVVDRGASVPESGDSVSIDVLVVGWR